MNNSPITDTIKNIKYFTYYLGKIYFIIIILYLTKINLLLVEYYLYEFWNSKNKTFYCT